jgi:hypothetical protein
VIWRAENRTFEASNARPEVGEVSQKDASAEGLRAPHNVGSVAEVAPQLLLR